MVCVTNRLLTEYSSRRWALRCFQGDPAHAVSSGDDAQGADGSQTEALCGSTHGEVVGQEYRHAEERAEQEAFPFSCLELLQSVLSCKAIDVLRLEGVPLRESELFSDRRRPVCLAPYSLGDVERLEDREER